MCIWEYTLAQLQLQFKFLILFSFIALDYIQAQILQSGCYCKLNKE